MNVNRIMVLYLTAYAVVLAARTAGGLVLRAMRRAIKRAHNSNTTDQR